MPFDLKRITRPNIWALKPYRCARDDYTTGILLDANENSYGPCTDDAVNSNYRTISSDYHLERYPDPRQDEIKASLCKLRNVESTHHFFIGVGSDECIDLAMRIFCEPGKEKILITPPTYGMYSVSAQINDIATVKVALDDKFQLKVDQDPLIKIVFLCSPGNPTGTLLRKSDIQRILESSYQGIVFVDEAYIDFNEKESLSSWVTKYPNLIVSQTLSKAFGLAGARLGFTISSKEIAELFNKTKAPYNISTPTSLIAKSAVSETGIAKMRENVAKLIQQRNYLIEKFKRIDYFAPPLGDNDANFILVPVLRNGVPDNEFATNVYLYLAQVQGIVVRFRGNEPGCKGCLRITVGTEKENDILLKKLESDEIKALKSQRK